VISLRIASTSKEYGPSASWAATRQLDASSNSAAVVFEVLCLLCAAAV
jgi:hypothetical protein